MSALRHPLAKARGLGSAKEGAGTWVTERISALALVPLSIWFVFAIATAAASGYADVRTALAQPWNASLMAAFVLCLFHHGALGLRVVVEDYVHTPWLEVSLQLAIKLVFSLAAIATLVAIARIALGA